MVFLIFDYVYGMEGDILIPCQVAYEL